MSPRPKASCASGCCAMPATDSDSGDRRSRRLPSCRPRATVKGFSHLAAAILGQDPAVQGGRRVEFLASDDDGAAAEIGALAERLSFAPISLGGLSDGGLLVHARGNNWGKPCRRESSGKTCRQLESRESPQRAAQPGTVRFPLEWERWILAKHPCAPNQVFVLSISRNQRCLNGGRLSQNTRSHPSGIPHAGQFARISNAPPVSVRSRNVTGVLPGSSGNTNSAKRIASSRCG